MPRYDAEGYEYTYSVEEIAVTGYSTTYDGLNITNTLITVPGPDPTTPDPGTPDPTTSDPGTPDPGTPAPGGTPVPIVPVAAMPDAGVLGVIRLPEEEDEEGVESGVLGERRGVLGVHTGDEAPVAGMLGLMGIAALAVEELLRRRKKNAR